MDDIQELYHLFPELKDHILIEKKIGQGLLSKYMYFILKRFISKFDTNRKKFLNKGTFSFVYLGHFHRNEKEKLALKYVIPTSSPSRTQQEIECLLNIG